MEQIALPVVEQGLQLARGQLLATALIAVAIGLDALSMGLAIGLRSISRSNMLRMGAVTAIFHVILPLMGMIMGDWAGKRFGQMATLAAGAMLILLGVHMIYNALRKDEESPLSYSTLLGVMAIAFSVSLDSFSVGITLGVFAADLWLTLSLFGLAGGGLMLLGLFLGKRLGAFMGGFGEACGGAILFVFGLVILI